MGFFDYPQRYFPKDRDEQGNAAVAGLSIPSYNRMSSDDSLAVQQAKQQAQNRQLQNQSLSPLAFSPYMAYMAHNSNSQPQDVWGAVSKILDTYTASLSSLGASGQGLESLGKLAPYFAQYLGVRGF